jgi:hypothetical protein
MLSFMGAYAGFYILAAILFALVAINGPIRSIRDK